ncbi:DUF4168 domain-containing protein [Wenzhouxiangella sp. AB-CW3]|uniref:DUF4168 domain-containing protein n=1 Tax=Wenzhouxiangella sp. AB-CW3 TaxID=2771012 RepID=UPI00168BA196|nr:DUF4168 domain-containing protein [Wenzhouxiangella sp. AB-CW3]QOC23238.1 DUF4168 domain-containing protein [Wenzhouxiangella sp. AB-CW3]
MGEIACDYGKSVTCDEGMVVAYSSPQDFLLAAKTGVMQMTLRKLITLMTFSIALAIGGAVYAQYDEAPPPAEPEQTDVSDQELQQFAEAQTEISSIQQDFSARLQGVDDPEEAHELQVEANEKMTDAVEDAGLDVESFNRIAMAVQNDPELQEQLTDMIQ